MNRITPTQLTEQLNWRYATKQFDPDHAISQEDWDALELALVLSPSSIGLQPWKFLVIEDPELRAKLQPSSYGQSQIVDAAKLVVFATKTNYSEADLDEHIARAAQVRGMAVEDLAPLKDMALNGVIRGMDETTRAAWAINQTYIALGNLLTSAALLGIDACPMEGFSRDQYDEILNLKIEGLHAVVVATLGYRSPEDKYASLPKVRFDRDSVVRHL